MSNFFVGILEILKHQKDILKLTDLYIVSISFLLFLLGHLDRVVHGHIADDILTACDEHTVSVNVGENVGSNPALHFFRGLRHRNLAAIKLAAQSGINQIQGQKSAVDQIQVSFLFTIVDVFLSYFVTLLFINLFQHNKISFFKFFFIIIVLTRSNNQFQNWFLDTSDCSLQKKKQ